MEPEYVPCEFPDPWHPDAVYCKASMRPSCRRLANTTHGDSSETNPRRAGDGQEPPDTPGTFLDRINRYQRVVTNEPPHTETDSRRPKLVWGLLVAAWPTLQFHVFGIGWVPWAQSSGALVLCCWHIGCRPQSCGCFLCLWLPHCPISRIHPGMSSGPSQLGEICIIPTGLQM